MFVNLFLIACASSTLMLLPPPLAPVAIVPRCSLPETPLSAHRLQAPHTHRRNSRRHAYTAAYPSLSVWLHPSTYPPPTRIDSRPCAASAPGVIPPPPSRNAPFACDSRTQPRYARNPAFRLLGHF